MNQNRITDPIQFTVRDLSGNGGGAVFMGCLCLLMGVAAVVFLLARGAPLADLLIPVVPSALLGAGLIQYGKWLNRPKARFEIVDGLVKCEGGAPGAGQGWTENLSSYNGVAPRILTHTGNESLWEEYQILLVHKTDEARSVPLHYWYSDVTSREHESNWPARADAMARHLNVPRLEELPTADPASARGFRLRPTEQGPLAFPLQITVRDLSGSGDGMMLIGIFFLAMAGMAVPFFLLAGKPLTSILIPVLSAILGAGAIQYGKRLNRPKARFEIADGLVKCLGDTPDAARGWTENLSNYQGVAPRIFKHVGKKSLWVEHQILLVHKSDETRSVPLHFWYVDAATEEHAKNWAARTDELARHLNLPKLGELPTVYPKSGRGSGR